MENLLLPHEAAEILRVTPCRIYELCRQKALPHVRLGRQVRISPEALRQFLAGGGKPLMSGWKRER